ncbi:4131_t:CDS:1, partial [Diversispora eburnea]
MSYVISYHYKYIYKGSNQLIVTIQIEDENKSGHKKIDEIKDYLN